VTYGDPIDLSAASAGTVSRFYVPDAGNVPVLILDAPPGTTTLHAPTLPAAAKTVLKQNQAGVASVASLIDNDAKNFVYLRVAYSHPLTFSMP
jgi:hypothetical protein